MKYDVFASTHVGRRNNNEDAFGVFPHYDLFVVADGMGGYQGGEIASQLALTNIAAFFDRNTRDRDATWPYAMSKKLTFAENMVNTSIQLAHQHILIQRQGHLNKMGTTVVMLWFSETSATQNQRVVIGHVGDSRAYRWRKDVLERLTTDHSLYEEFKATGMKLPPLEEFHLANVITRALGMETKAQPDITTHHTQPGDRFLLCTDGLTGPLSEEQLHAHLALPSAQDACSSLIRAAYEAGGKDNITALVVDVV